ncbi:MAG: PEP/pyruvate-binding domain-containing protein, partial [Oligoflexales bacterium]|nr:PEP/pyruvate-binding domain-containing protein [Oligoflexales bacterium]
MFHLFDEIKNNPDLKSRVGKKALSLIEMTEWGVPVPDGGCILTDGLDQFIRENGLTDIISSLGCKAQRSEIPKKSKHIQKMISNGKMPEELSKKMKAFIQDNPGRHFAVRSSGTKEDLANMSFAGQYTSILNVKDYDYMTDAVKKCWASLFNERLLNYCMDNAVDLESMKLAVIVQQMIPSVKSGVLFTINPLKGYDRQMVIEAVYGLGEALVGGETTPDQYLYDWYNKKEDERILGEKSVSIVPISITPFTKKIVNSRKLRESYVLSGDEVARLCEIALKIQVKYGFPVDIEWAMHDGRFFIVQSRPVTKISYSGIFGEWTTADFKDGGVSSTVCTPYMWALYDLILENSMDEYLRKIRLLDRPNGKNTYGAMHFGRPYWNAHITKECLKKLPDFIERDFDEDIGIEPTYEGRGFVSRTNLKTVGRAAKVLYALKKSLRSELRDCSEFKELQIKKLARLENLDPTTMDEKEFFSFFKKLIREEYFLSESRYFNFIYSNSNFQSLFKKKMFKLDADVDLLTL